MHNRSAGFDDGAEQVTTATETADQTQKLAGLEG